MKPEDYYRRHAKLGNVDGVWQNHVNKNKARELLANSKIFEANINNPKVPSGKPGDLAPGPYKDLVEKEQRKRDIENHYTKDDRGNSKGAMKNFVKEQRALNTPGVTPKVSPKVRQESMLERIETVQYELGDSKVKPAHYDNPNIVSYENWKKKPEKWDGYHNISNDQKQQSVAWDLHLNIAKKPQTPEQKREALDTKRMLRETYNNPKLKNTLAEDELKLIGKHKSQQPKVTPVVTPGVPLRKPFRPSSPSVDVNEFINQKTKMKYGISEDLVRLNKEIDRNVKYVLGEDQKEKSESENEKNNTNNEEINYDL